ncbi:acyl-CoA dehydrogenase family protein [Aquisalimonas lutea]|uniref:acyl-CoA dehydrogenase family protein n=1 Tax=Aquisalimonas lutea TaxID=1327750 RepID=UPI0025B4DC7F|nr:acyl-CoA dehydrogenase family protein [Aquisalimonas lutea]MDN3516483.1 acyl-CoA dehydrogenase family protein [Aquisalimonas lutea]
MSDLETFRRETRAWLEANCPASMRTPMTGDDDVCWGGRKWTFKSTDQRLWLERMAERGWTAPDWPAEYGGGLGKDETRVLREEMDRIRARPPLHSFGIWMIGPAILRFGPEHLRRQHLPPIVRGEIRWCQGYSEPGAGSDLAGLQTRAEDRGDHFIVNGQKIWTSHADRADWMFCLVRTNPDAKKQAGISLVLFDMNTPGVSTRPITLISGSSPFCETFLDNVRVEKDQVVGEVDQGWTIAKYLLTHEREMIGGFGRTAAGARTVGEQAVEAVGLEDGRLADELLRGEVARWEMDARAFELTAERARAEARAGQGVGNSSAMLKYYGTELNKRRHELLMALNGSDGLLWQGKDGHDGALARQWLRSKGNSIEGGTSEIQLNIIARNILGLG